MDAIASIAVSGLAAATAKLDASASNIANMNDVSPVGGVGAYRPVGTVNSAQPGGGVTATTVTLKPSWFLAYDPLSPVANIQGMVVAPQIDPILEISAQMQAGQAYAGSILARKAADEMSKSTLDLTA